jgi:hypothetical protein
MMKPGQGILNYLKHQGRSIDLPFEALRQFQEFEKSLAAALDSYADRPAPVAYGMRSYIILEMMAAAIIADGHYPAVQRCLDDLNKRFKNSSATDPEMIYMSWFYFNFPVCINGPSLAEEILNRKPGLGDSIGSFLKAGIASRLGLYEVLSNAKGMCHLRELFTDREINLDQSFGKVSRGNLVLTRPIDLLGTQSAFGDIIELPAARREMIVDMVAAKMLRYFGAPTDIESYETMMRLAGPYWFSVVLSDDGEILDPDHYLSYYGR